MRSKFIILIVLLISILISESCTKPTIFNVNGKIDAQNNPINLLFSYDDLDGNTIIDTLQIKDNIFQISGKINGISMATIYKDSISEFWDDQNVFHFFIEPGNLDVDINIVDLRLSKVSGSKIQDEFIELEKQNKKQEDYLDSLISYRNILIKKNSIMKDPILSNEIDSIDSIQKVLLNDSKKNDIDYIRKNRGSLLSGYLLNKHFNELPIENVKQLYKSLKINVKNSYFGYILKNNLTFEDDTRRIKENDIASNFSLLDKDSTNYQLSSFNHKNILLIFWASWCEPCRKENIILRDIYTDLTTKNLEIVSISFDDNRDNWLKASKEDSIPWINLIEEKNFKSQISQLYNVKSLPKKILLDNNKKIIKIDFPIIDIDSLNHKINIHDQ